MNTQTVTHNRTNNTYKVNTDDWDDILWEIQNDHPQNTHNAHQRLAITTLVALGKATLVTK